MSRTVETIGLAVIAIGVSLFIPWALPFLGTIAGTSVTTIIGSIAASGIMALGQSLLVPAQKRTLSVREPLSTHKVITGQMKVGGAITFIDSSSDNKDLFLVITLAGHPVFSIDGIYLNDTYVPLDSSGNAQNPQVWPDGTKPISYKNHAQIIKGLGTNTGDVAFLTAIGAASSKWGSNFFQYGRAKIYVSLYWDQNLYGSTGMPNISAVVRGRMVLDPRDTSKTITTSTAAAPGVFTTSGSHGLVPGQMVFIKGHSGAIPANSQPTWPAAQRNSVAQEYEVNTTPSMSTFTLVGPDSQPLNLTNGGSGGTVTPMRWSDNSVLAAYDYLVEPYHGLGVIYDTEVDENLVIAGANLCDEIVARAVPTSTFTANASSDLITYVENINIGPLPPLCEVVVSNSGGSLPGGLSAGTVYWFAQAGAGPGGYLCTNGVNAAHVPPIHINITSAGSGTNSITIAMSTVPDASTDTLGVANTALRLTTGTEVTLGNFGGSLPSGLSAGNYWVIFLSDIVLQLATTLDNARKGIAVGFSTNGSGITYLQVVAEPRYTANGIVDTGESRQAVIQKLLSSCGGYLVPSGVLLNITPAQYLTPTVTLSESDLRGPIQVTTLQSGSASFNSVKGTFIDPFNKGQPTDYPQVQNSTYVAQDNYEVIWKDLTLEFTNSSSMAQRLAKIDLERVRRELTVTMPLKLTAFQVGSPDTIMVNNAMWGWAAETFEVSSWRFSIAGDDREQTLNVDIVGRQTDSAVYAFTSAEEAAAKRQTNTNLPNPFVVQPPTGLTLTSGGALAITQPDGTVVSQLKVEWVSPVDQFVLNGGFIEVAYKLHSASVWTIIGSWVPGDQMLGFVDGLLVGAVYDVAIRARNAIGAVSDDAAVFPWQAQQNSYTIAGKTNAPSDVGSITVTVQGQTVTLVGAPISDADVVSYEYRYGASASWAGMTVLAQAPAIPNGSGGFAGAYTAGNIAAGTYYFGVKAINRSGTYSANAAYSGSTVVTISGAPPGPGTVTAAMFAAGVTPVLILSGAPPTTPGTTTNQVAISTTDNNLYRWTGSAWTLVVTPVSPGAILPNQLVSLGDLDNLILDANCLDTAYWTNGGLGNTITTSVIGGAWFSSHTLASTADASNDHGIDSSAIKAVAGEYYYASATLGLDNANASGLSIYLVFFDSSNTYISETTFGTMTAAGGPTLFATGSSGIQAPANTAYFILRAICVHHAGLTGNFQMGGPTVRHQNDAKLIVDGAVDTSKLANLAVTTAKVVDTAITTAKIDNLAVTTAKIDTLGVTTGKIADTAITTAKLGDAAVIGSKIAIGDFTNLITNPQFVNGAGSPSSAGWDIAASPPTVYDFGSSYGASGWPSRYGGHQIARDVYFLTTATSGSASATNGMIPVKPGQTYYMECTAQNSTPVDCFVGLHFVSIDGTQETWVAAFTVQQGAVSATFYSHQITIPATVGGVTTGWANPHMKINAFSSFGDFYYTNVVLRKAAGAELLVDGSITAAKIVAATITSTQIAANTIVANNLAANSVTASKVFIGSTDNLILDGNCQDPSYWGGTNMGTLITQGTAPGSGWLTGNVIAGIKVGVTEGDISTVTQIPVIAGDWYYISGQTFILNKNGNNGGLFYLFYKNDNTYTGVGGGFYDTGSSGAIQTWGGPVQAPSNAAYIQFYLFTQGNSSGNCYLGAPFIRHMNAGNLIVDGAISAVKITANTITTGQIAAGGIAADRIVANSITTTQITAGGIAADRLVANSITTTQISAGGVNADRLVANSITASQIAAGTITANEIHANTITAAKIAANTITTSEIAANAITAGQISAGAINATTIIADNMIIGKKLITGEASNVYVVNQGGSAITISATLNTEIFRVTTTALGGVINVTVSFNSNAIGSGSFGNYTWLLRATTVGGSTGTDFSTHTWNPPNATQQRVVCFGSLVTGFYLYGDTFDVVLYCKGDSTKTADISQAQMQVTVHR